MRPGPCAAVRGNRPHNPRCVSFRGGLFYAPGFVLIDPRYASVAAPRYAAAPPPELGSARQADRPAAGEGASPRVSIARVAAVIGKMSAATFYAGPCGDY